MYASPQCLPPNTLCYRSVPWHPCLIVSTEHGIVSLSSFSLVFTNTPLLLLETLLHKEHTDVLLSLSCKRVCFHWLPWLFLLGTRLSLVKNNLSMTLRLKVTTLSFTSLLTPDITMSKYIRINALPYL